MQGALIVGMAAVIVGLCWQFAAGSDSLSLVGSAVEGIGIGTVLVCTAKVVRRSQNDLRNDVRRQP